MLVNDLFILLLTEGFDPFNFGVFICIGRYSWNCDKKGVYATRTSHSETCKSFFENGYLKEKLKANDHLSAVWSLRLRLSKTQGSSVPALGLCNVWGFVAYSTSPTTARRVLSAWHSKILPKYCDRAEGKNEEQSVEAGIITVSETDSPAFESFEIPEEFLDGLTFEIMSIPVRLPSGNVIDEQTFERFNKQEAGWGRPPSDPFTSQPITAERRPVYDTALKARIDAFLLKESHRACFKNVPRTLGNIKTRSDDALLGFSSKPPSLPGPARPSSSSHASSSQSSNAIDPSRRTLSSLATSLQQLASRGKSNEPSAVKRKAPSAVSLAICPCGNQNVPANQAGRTLYSLPCSHHMCRTCLLAMKSSQTEAAVCQRCQTAFRFHDVALYHGH